MLFKYKRLARRINRSELRTLQFSKIFYLQCVVSLKGQQPDFPGRFFTILCVFKSHLVHRFVRKKWKKTLPWMRVSPNGTGVQVRFVYPFLWMLYIPLVTLSKFLSNFYIYSLILQSLFHHFDQCMPTFFLLFLNSFKFFRYPVIPQISKKHLFINSRTLFGRLKKTGQPTWERIAVAKIGNPEFGRKKNGKTTHLW